MMGIYDRYIFPRIMDRVMSRDPFSALRHNALEGVRGRTLEIGFGSGLNLPHYPPAITRLDAIDVNPGMYALAGKRCSRSSIEVNYSILDGQCLPMGNESFDSVVSTWTLCSIPEVARALGEIRRVLAADGHFFFIEHGLSNEPAVSRWQHWLTPVQRIIADGCHLDRNIEALMKSAGFRILELENSYLEGFPRVAGFLYRGVAVK